MPAHLISLIFTLALCFGGDAATAQEFKPYPEAKVSVEQWQKYVSKVRGKFGKTLRELDDRLIYVDTINFITFTFTKPNHAAHPAWVARLVVRTEDKMLVRQQGFYAGDEKAFNAFVAEQEALNELLRQGLLLKDAPATK